MRRPIMLTLAEKRRAALGASISPAEYDVLVERRNHMMRQGWTASHDDKHSDGEMAFAGACYALAGAFEHPTDHFLNTTFTRYWVWAREWWKPKDRRRNLVRAASLLIAEIERLDRAANAPGRQQSSLPRSVGIAEGASSGKRGGLNPTWVEWLMGFPMGWTELKVSATPSSRKSRKSSGEKS